MKLSKKEIEFIIKSGEGIKAEFKESFDSKNIAKEMVAFANSEGGRIFLGVSDLGEVKGIKITNQLKSTLQDIARNCDPPVNVSLEEVDQVLIVTVEEGANKPYRCSAGFFLRQGANSQKLSTEEIREFFNKERKILFDEAAHATFSFQNGFDRKKLNAFLTKAKISPVIPEKDILKNMGILTGAGKFKNAGVLFFCKKAGLFIPQAIVTGVLYKGKDKTYIIDKKDFDEDIISNYENVMKFLYTNLKIIYRIEGSGPRKEILEVPEEALKECLLNALAHRDYSERGAQVQVDVFDDRIEMSNPGGLIIKKEEFGKRSLSRNPLLFSLMQKADLVEHVGSGISRIREALQKAGLKAPQFEFGKFFAVTLWRPDERELGRMVGKPSPQKTPQKTPQKPTKREEEVLAFISKNSTSTRAEIALKLELSPETVKEYLAKLKEKGLLKRIGPDKGGYWEVLK